MIDWQNRLAKWRSVFAGWQLGTRTKADPECQAVRDHREVTMLMRAELNALAVILARKQVFTMPEFRRQVQEECRLLCEAYEKRFPGFKATDDGMQVNPETSLKTTRGWKP